jgi:hypothetical protein
MAAVLSVRNLEVHDLGRIKKGQFLIWRYKNSTVMIITCSRKRESKLLEVVLCGNLHPCKKVLAASCYYHGAAFCVNF